MERVRKRSIVRVAFQRIAYFENSAGGVVAVEVDGERIVGPFPDFVRECRDVLRECSRMIDVGSFCVR